MGRPQLVLPPAYEVRRFEARRCVKALGISVTELARRVGRSRETTSRVLSGSRFSMDVLRRIEEALLVYFDETGESGS
ncbi:MAG: helix-turn-helix domain-containing protein [Rhodothermales bacterium]